MKKLLFLGCATILSCTSISSPKTSEMKKNIEILASESQGGANEAGFSVIKNDEELQKAMNGNPNLFVLEGTKPASSQLIKFPIYKKVVLYNLGMYRSGDHRITEIKSTYTKDKVLYVEVPYVEHGGMEIQMISNPYIIFTVPLHYDFTSVQLKYSK